MCEDTVTIVDHSAELINSGYINGGDLMVTYKLFGDVLDDFLQGGVLTVGPNITVYFTSCSKTGNMPYRGFLIKFTKSGKYILVSIVDK